jgi:hypothetical protein
MNEKETRGTETTEREVNSAAFDEAGQALFALIRLLGRPLGGDAPATAAGRAVELSRIMVVQAVEAAGDAGPPARR